MAFLKSDFEFTCSIGNVSAYKLPGADGTVLRTKGGTSKKKILKAPDSKLTRQNFTKSSGCPKLVEAARGRYYEHARA